MVTSNAIVLDWYIWPGKRMKRGYKLEKMFKYNEHKEDKLIWCRGTVQKVTYCDDKEIRADVKWMKKDIGKYEADKSNEILKKQLWNVSKQQAGGWRENLRHLEIRV